MRSSRFEKVDIAIVVVHMLFSNLVRDCGVLSPFRLRSNAACSLLRTESFASTVRNVRNGSSLKPLALDFPRAAFSAAKEFSRKMAMTIKNTLAGVTAAQLSEKLVAPRACGEKTQMETAHRDTSS